MPDSGTKGNTVGRQPSWQRWYSTDCPASALRERKNQILCPGVARKKAIQYRPAHSVINKSCTSPRLEIYASISPALAAGCRVLITSDRRRNADNVREKLKCFRPTAENPIGVAPPCRPMLRRDKSNHDIAPSINAYASRSEYQ